MGVSWVYCVGKWGGELTGITKSSFCASSLMGKERPYRSLHVSAVAK
jgi:hypothetical protein